MSWNKNSYKLNLWLTANKDLTFEWGVSDCVLFVCSALAEMGNVDFASKSRGMYTNAKEAYRHLKKQYKVNKLEDIADIVLGDRSPISFALQGSVVARLESNSELGYTLGICNGAISWFISDSGLLSISTLDCEWCYNGQSS